MKKLTAITSIILLLTLINSCKKDECSDCHYDKDGAEVELGEKCGTEIETLEKDGYTINGVKYTVHCGEGH